MPEENFVSIISDTGDDGELLLKLREIYNWSLLNDILAGELSISKAKVEVYEQHKYDLKVLKRIAKKYLPKEKVDFILKSDNQDNYAAYSGHSASKKCDKEAFSIFLQKQLKDIEVSLEDQEIYSDMMERIALRKFLPKQVDGDNRVIPYQLYWNELNQILENAKDYLSFLNEEDEEGYVNAEKLLSIFEFRIPYFVGPLRTDNSKNSWMKRQNDKVGKIYPWNFNEMVDLDASEHAFISRMTNKCTYLPILYLDILRSPMERQSRMKSMRTRGRERACCDRMNETKRIL